MQYHGITVVAAHVYLNEATATVCKTSSLSEVVTANYSTAETSRSVDQWLRPVADH